MEDLKEKVALSLRVMINEGLIEMFGHVSARLPGADRIWINRSIHDGELLVGEISAADIVAMDLEGQPLDGAHDLPGERFIHTEIYKARPDVGSVIHAHPWLSTSFSAAGQAILPISITALSFFGEGVPIYERVGQIETPEEGAAMAQCLGRSAAVLLRAHGSVVAGRTVEEACVAAVELERTAQKQLVCSLLRMVPPLSPQDLIRPSQGMGGASQVYCGAQWAWYRSRLAARGTATYS